ncbi:MAG: glycoside hydrolase family 57 protein [Bacillota bacterium]
MPKGYLALVLHAHLPYVRHPEDPDALEERWLFEGITETYIPLLAKFEKLVEDGVDFRLTMSFSPTLTSMLLDPLLQERYYVYLSKLRELIYKELDRTYGDPRFHRLAQMYHYLVNQCFYYFFEKYAGNLLTGYRRLQEAGRLELITCGATHAYFPLNGLSRQAVRAQVALAVENHWRVFGSQPQGMWLPECAYHPGDDEFLAEFGIRYFFLDTHGVLFASTRPRYGVYAPIVTPAGVAAFGRDVESSKQVWSADEGYPGDFDYREFYRDIGYDLDYDYIKDYLHPSGIRLHTGIKYYRITGKKSEWKEPYVPEWATEKAAIHAGNFMFNRERQVEYLASLMDRKPIVVAPYDAELFGHWWFEGPQFLDFLLRKIHYDSKILKTATPSDYLAEYPRNQVTEPCISSWGHKGYHEVWLEGSNDWIYRHLHKAAERMTELARRFTNPTAEQERALNQAARELLLAQASDWAFIMKTGTMVNYAIRRTKNHIHNFTRLYEQLLQNQLDLHWLQELETTNNLFPWLNYRIYAWEAPPQKARASV